MGLSGELNVGSRSSGRPRTEAGALVAGVHRRKRDEFPGIEEPGRVERVLHAAHHCQSDGVPEPAQCVALELSYPVFGDDRTVPLGDEPIDLLADRFAVALLPADRVHAGWGDDVKMDVAVAQVTECDRARA